MRIPSFVRRPSRKGDLLVPVWRTQLPPFCGRRLWARDVGTLSLAFAACAALAWLLPHGARAQSLGEYQVKAVFLYNFAKFVEWPHSAFEKATDPIVIGIAGEDPFGPILDQTLQGKTVNGRSLIVKRFKSGQSPKNCHILFVGSSEQGHLSAMIEGFKAEGVLTVGESEHFAREGGIIRFTTEDSRIRFEINVDVAEQTHLKLSSKLLSLARIVHADGRGGRS